MLGATVVRANFHRYAIDANRDPADVSLYPGRNTTSLCPVTNFDGQPIWNGGQEPSRDEILARCAAYHGPYHAALRDEVERALRCRDPVRLPFDPLAYPLPIRRPPAGLLDWHDGREILRARPSSRRRPISAPPHPEPIISSTASFKGGWTTRYYGRPEIDVHAIQMELVQRVYLVEEAAPWVYDPVRADRLRITLRQVHATLDRLARSGALND